MLEVRGHLYYRRGGPIRCVHINIAWPRHAGEGFAMKLKIVAVGGLRDDAMRSLAETYVARTRRHVTVEEIEVDSGGGSGEEADRLLSRIGERDTVIALDEHGRHLTSEELADWLERQMVGSVGPVTWCIGGADGLDGRVKQRAAWSLSLSKMTFPHQLARVLLAEQLYRATTIIEGEPYHR
jgi:23S rRNA (pseudouridine1915-N3)-methyltransferase